MDGRTSAGAKAMNPYPKIGQSLHDDVVRVLEVAIQERKNDIKDFDNLTNVFIRGRKVDKVPSGATDITAADRVGDFNYDADYLYIVVDDAGTAEWRRAAIASW